MIFSIANEVRIRLITNPTIVESRHGSGRACGIDVDDTQPFLRLRVDVDVKVVVQYRIDTERVISLIEWTVISGDWRCRAFKQRMHLARQAEVINGPLSVTTNRVDPESDRRIVCRQAGVIISPDQAERLLLMLGERSGGDAATCQRGAKIVPARSQFPGRRTTGDPLLPEVDTRHIQSHILIGIEFNYEFEELRRNWLQGNFVKVDVGAGSGSRRT